MFNRIVNVNPVYVVNDGVVIDPEWANSRPIPAVIVNAGKNRAVTEYIEAHKSQPPGDVIVQWGSGFFSKKEVFLILKAERPTILEFAIIFDSKKHAALIDGILRTNGVYLQTGKAGDRVSGSLHKSRILIEVPSVGFEPIWEKIILKVTKASFQNKGLSKRDANNSAKNHIKSMREFWDRRKS